MASKDVNETNTTTKNSSTIESRNRPPPLLMRNEPEQYICKYYQDKLLQEELEINADILKSFGINMPQGCNVQQLVKILSEHSDPKALELAQKYKDTFLSNI